jgi:hypothetical protein
MAGQFIADLFIKQLAIHLPCADLEPQASPGGDLVTKILAVWSEATE